MKIIPITPRRHTIEEAWPELAQHPLPPGAPLRDQRARELRDLRISITDRCNFRCIYCMPGDVFDKDHLFLPHSDLLSFEEITRVAQRFAAHGVRKIRLTGGEPLLRKHMERLVAQLAKIDGIELALTTNGVLLPKMAQRLKDAGLNRVTISLDTLDDATFRKINGVNFPVSAVLEGIDAAAAAGLNPIKINTVIKRGTNHHHITAIAQHFRHTGHIVRFIEFMDVGTTNGWKMDEVVPSREVVERISALYPLEPIDANYDGEVTERWRYRDGAGEIGVISSVTQAFCASCTRLRLSTEGKLYTCLFAQQGHDLRLLLRSGTTDNNLIDKAIASVWQNRDDRYSEARTAHTPGMQAQRKIEMSYIGG